MVIMIILVLNGTWQFKYKSFLMSEQSLHLPMYYFPFLCSDQSQMVFNSAILIFKFYAAGYGNTFKLHLLLFYYCTLFIFIEEFL